MNFIRLDSKSVFFTYISHSLLATFISLAMNFCYLSTLQDLEKNLKATCEEFIMSVTKLVVDPMLSFVTKVCHLS